METTEPRLIILQPTRGSISVETQQALASNLDGIESIVVQVARLPVDVARNKLAEIAREAIPIQQPAFANAFVLWVDDDAWWQQGTVAAMMRRLSTLNENDVLSARFCVRSPFAPAIMSSANGDHSQSDEMEVDMIGCHFIMHRRALLDVLGERPFTLIDTEDGKLGEDYSFSQRVRAIGGRCIIAPASEATVLHVDAVTGLAYAPYWKPLKISNGNVLDATIEDIEQGILLAGGSSDDVSDDIRVMVAPSTQRLYGEAVDDASDAAIASAEGERESPVVVLSSLPTGNAPGQPIAIDLDGMSKEEAYAALMSVLDTRAVEGFTLMPRAEKKKSALALAEFVGTSKSSGKNQIIVSTKARP